MRGRQRHPPVSHAPAVGIVDVKRDVLSALDAWGPCDAFREAGAVDEGCSPVLHVPYYGVLANSDLFGPASSEYQGAV